MSQPSVLAAVQKLTQASAGLRVAGQRMALTRTVASLPAAALQSLNLCGCKAKQGHSYSTSSHGAGGTGSGTGRNVLSVSSILLQDGLEIQELPILVRLLDKGMVPLTNHTYTGEQIRAMTAEDENFEYLLQQCVAVQDVFKLLEIPSERVNGYSASAALLRMWELQKMNSDWGDLHSFIRTAVMNELNDTVSRDIAKLSNETLISLVACYMHMESFGQECMSAINGEIEKRMVEELFSIEQLLSINSLLHTSERGDKDLIKSIWVYIGNHYHDVKEDNIAGVLAWLPPSHKYLLKVLGRQLHKVWWKMKAEDTVSCLSSLVQLNTLQVSMMTDFAHWLFLNIHQVSEDGLMQFVAAFIHFRFSDPNFTTALERYVGVRGDQLNTSLLGLIMEYCRTRRYFSPAIMDVAARHFEQLGHTYSALQVFTVLRPFGQLNYIPKDSHNFLLQTEKILAQQFSDFEPAHLSELLCSFAFIEKIPLNFVHRVLTPSFLSKVKESHEAGLWLEMLQSAVKLETRGVRIPCLYKVKAGSAWRDERLWMIQSRLEEALVQLIGSNLLKSRTFASGTVYLIDTEVHLTKEGQPTPVVYPGGQPSTQAATRLAILIMTADHYCINSGHLLGQFAMRRRHLHKLGYTVVEVFDAEFLPLNSAERQNYMKKKLGKWINSATFGETAT